MTEQTKEKLKYWLIGIFTGGAVAAPVTAFICKNVYEKKIAEAEEQAETRGMNAMAEYAVQQQAQEEVSQDIPLAEEDYEEKDPREYDVGIDDADEQEVITYSTMVKKYTGEELNEPRVISAEEFDQDQSNEKHFVNWYTADNVFEEDGKSYEDPLYYFGTLNGADLFSNAEHRRDPNLVYIRTDKCSMDFEVTKVIGSYREIWGGERYLGETDT